MPKPSPLTEHPFAQYVRILGRGKRSARSLTEQEAYEAMKMILNEDVEDTQIGAFLLLIRVREETTEELVGFVKAIHEYTHNTLPQLNATLDWPSYAGKHKQLNWYILAALALADSGVSVFMHGSNEHTPDRLYSNTVLKELGIPLCASTETARASLKDSNFAYMDLKTFCAPLDKLIALRSILGVRSPIHTLVRLANPSASPHLITSIFHPSYRASHQEAAQQLGYKSMAVFKGEGGEVERKPDARCLVQTVQDNVLFNQEWESIMNTRTPNEQDFSVNKLRKIWRGTEKSHYGESAIISTLAIVLLLMKRVNSQKESLVVASELWSERNLQRL